MPVVGTKGKTKVAGTVAQVAPAPVAETQAPAQIATATEGKKERGPSLQWNKYRLKALITNIRHGQTDPTSGEQVAHTPKSLIAVLVTLPEFAEVAGLLTPEKVRLALKYLKEVGGPANGKDFSDLELAHDVAKGGFANRKRDIDWDELAAAGTGE